MANSGVCLVATFLVHLSIWQCSEGRLLQRKGSTVNSTNEGVTLGNISYPATSCNHYLSGVDDASVSDALAHKQAASSRANPNPKQLEVLQHQKIFVAACLHDSEAIMQHWTVELVRLLLSLKAASKKVQLFVSVYESGSSDRTKDYLIRLEDHLNFLGVPCKIVHGGITRSGRSRIEFLADVRNRALQPLRATSEAYDRVLWLSDNLFCADGVLQMLAHALPQPQGGLGADAVCGMDYMIGDDPVQGKGKCAFYDKWVAHDISGRPFRNFFPIVNYGENELEDGQAFQVFSCWNGMVVFDASIFQKERLLFRFHRDDLGECAVAETELIFRDMWNAGRGKIAVSPNAASAYSMSEFKKCALSSQPTEFDEDSAIAWRKAPKKVICCPLERGEDGVNFNRCFNEDWNRFNASVPRLNSTTSAYLSQPEYEGDANDEDWRGGDDGDDDSLVQIQHDVATHMPIVPAHSSSMVHSRWHQSGALALVLFVVTAYMSLSSYQGSVDGKQMYAVIIFWMVMSFSMNLLNKQCTILLRCPFTLVLIQMCVSVLMLVRTPLAGVRKQDLGRWCVTAVLFGAMLCSSMFAFTHSSVTCYLVLRNCLPLIILPVERVVFPDTVVSITMVAPLCAIALGAALYACFSPGSAASTAGFGWIVVNCLATVVHAVLSRYLLTSDMRLSFEAMTLINNVIPLFPVVALAWATGEMEHWPQYEHLLHAPMPLAVLACSGIVGLCLGQSSIMVQKCVTATTMMVLQTTTKLFIILAAMFFFNDRFTPISFVGCALSLLGCAAYGKVQHSAKQASVEHRPLLPNWKAEGKS